MADSSVGDLQAMTKEELLAFIQEQSSSFLQQQLDKQRDNIQEHSNKIDAVLAKLDALTLQNPVTPPPLYHIPQSMASMATPVAAFDSGTGPRLAGNTTPGFYPNQFQTNPPPGNYQYTPLVLHRVEYYPDRLKEQGGFQATGFYKQARMPRLQLPQFKGETGTSLPTMELHAQNRNLLPQFQFVVFEIRFQLHSGLILMRRWT
ncbi:unnamed protein product [Linum trigynum]|uniref:Uncharacterized protein n=1 Tax=Linum trigynum TaxID=586398 RepID=A0AAV2FVY3_9ROSI